MCCDFDMPFEAIENGHLECLQRAYKNNCVWNEGICNHAPYYGQLECLKFALENGCPCDDLCLIDIAEENGEIGCLEYICENSYTYEFN